MSVALYRRYRPDTFTALIGQDVIARTLRNEVRAQTVAHAYLFAGVRGTGKTSTARILARAVNCLDVQDGEPCNRCAACRELIDGTSVDVLEIDAASNRGIDEMRDLREKVKYLPASLTRKVYIIDEAHMLTTEAWNAFLKTLEEPPEHVFFVLATTEPHKVPETVRSRVQRFDFRRVSAPEIAAHLTDVARREEIAVEQGAIELIARAAQGSVRDALSLLDQALSSGEHPLSLDAARRALGLTDPALVQELMRALAGADAAGTLRAASGAFAAGADPRQLLRDLARLGRAAEMVSLGYAEGADVAAEEMHLVSDVAAIAPPGFWLRALELYSEAEMNLRQPVDARLQVELCLLRLVRPPVVEGDDMVASLAARVAALERGSAVQRSAVVREEPVARGVETQTAAAVPSNGQPAPAQPEIETQAVPPVAVDSHGGAQSESVEFWKAEWPMLIEAVTRADTMLAGVLRSCRPVEAEPGRLVIGARGQFHYDRIREAEKAAVLAEAVANVAGKPVTVEARFIGEPRAQGEAPSGTLSEVTQEVLRTFVGSRVTATRLRDEGPQDGPTPSGDA